MARGEVERGEIIAESDDDELHVCPRGNVAFAGVDQRHSQRPGRVRSGRWTAGRQCESVQGDAPQHIVTGALLRESGPKIKTKKTGESGPQIALWLPRGLLTWMIRGRRPKADKFCIPNYMTTTDAFKKLNFQNVKYLNIFYTFLIPYNFYFFHWNHFKNFPQKLFGQILNYSKISWGQNSPTHNPPLGCGSTHSSAHPKWPKSTKKKTGKISSLPFLWPVWDDPWRAPPTQGEESNDWNPPRTFKNPLTSLGEGSLVNLSVNGGETQNKSSKGQE